MIAFCIGILNINRDLYETTEGRYAECAREMLAESDFLNPMLNYHAHWTKPPLTYWAIAMGIQVAHGSEWGVRLYLLFSFVGTTVCVYWLARLMWGTSVAPICALVYCTSLYPAVSSDIISTDMLLSFWEAVALLFFWMGFKEKKAWAYIAMWFAFGAAFLTKGPPGLLFLSGVIPTYLIGKRNGLRGPALFSPVGILCFIGVGLGWYIYEAVHTPGLLHYWLGSEVYERVLTDHFKRNSHWTSIFTVYGTILLFGSMPWALVLFANWKNISQKIRENFKCLLQPDKVQYFFLTISIFAPLTVFCISESRLHLYLLPMFVPISLIVGRIVHEYCASKALKRCLAATLIFAILLAFTGKSVVANKETKKSLKHVASEINVLLEVLPGEENLCYFGNQIPYSLQYYVGRSIDQILISPQEEEPTYTTDDIVEIFENDLQNGLSPVVLVNAGQLSILEDALYASPLRTYIINCANHENGDMEMANCLSQLKNDQDNAIFLVVIQ